MSEPWTREEFEARLRERGKAYHIHHPFNVMLNTGRASREQVRMFIDSGRGTHRIFLLTEEAEESFFDL